MPASSAPTLALLGSYREFPIPRHLIPAAILLLDLEYTGPAIDAVITHLHRYGSAVGCVYVDLEHRDMVEATLPFDPAYNSPAWNTDVWSIDSDRDFDDDGFEVEPQPSESRELVLAD